MSESESFFLTGKVVERGVTQKGKPKVKIESNGRALWYYPGSCDVSTMQIGMLVDIEGRFFPTANGKLPGIDVWGANNGAQQTPSDVQPGQPRFPQNGNAVKTTAPAPVSDKYRLPPTDQDQLRFLSNQLGNLSAGGVIKTRMQYRAWFNEICASLKGEENFDSDVPFT